MTENTSLYVFRETPCKPYNVPPPAGFVLPKGFPKHNPDFSAYLQRSFANCKACKKANVPLKVLTYFEYTRFYICNSLAADNWKLATGTFIHKCIRSFGAKDNGDLMHGVTQYLRLISDIGFSNSPEAQAKWGAVLGFFDTSYGNTSDKTDPKIIQAYIQATQIKQLYDEWLHIFPFHSPYFAELKTEYTNAPPFYLSAERTCEFTGTKIIELLTEKQISEMCRRMTDRLILEFDIKKIDTNEGNETIKDLAKLQFKFDTENDRLNVNSTNKDILALLKRWVKRCETYFNKVASLLPPQTPDAPPADTKPVPEAPPATATKPAAPEAPPITLTFKAEFVDRICKGFEPFFTQEDLILFEKLIQGEAPPAPLVFKAKVRRLLPYAFRVLYENGYLNRHSGIDLDTLKAWILKNFRWDNSETEFEYKTVRNEMTGKFEDLKAPANPINVIPQQPTKPRR